MKKLLILLSLFLFVSCQNEPNREKTEATEESHSCAFPGIYVVNHQIQEEIRTHGNYIHCRCTGGVGRGGGWDEDGNVLPGVEFVPEIVHTSRGIECEPTAGTMHR
jgi:hypothetical protein